MSHNENGGRHHNHGLMLPCGVDCPAGAYLAGKIAAAGGEGRALEAAVVEASLSYFGCAHRSVPESYEQWRIACAALRKFRERESGR